MKLSEWVEARVLARATAFAMKTGITSLHGEYFAQWYLDAILEVLAALKVQAEDLDLPHPTKDLPP